MDARMATRPMRLAMTSPEGETVATPGNGEDQVTAIPVSSAPREFSTRA